VLGRGVIPNTHFAPEASAMYELPGLLRDCARASTHAAYRTTAAIEQRGRPTVLSYKGRP